MKHVRKELDRELELVDEDELANLFADCEAGAIPPIGLAYDVETFLDEALTSLANVYFESGDHEHLVRVSGGDFKHLLSGVRHGHFSHDD
jgi:Ala-tRNA(Pro) deacylase